MDSHQWIKKDLKYHELVQAQIDLIFLKQKQHSFNEETNGLNTQTIITKLVMTAFGQH